MACVNAELCYTNTEMGGCTFGSLNDGTSSVERERERERERLR